MNYSTVYVGMDVHKESFSLCCYTNEKEMAEFPQKVEAHYSKVLNYIEAMRFHYGRDAMFICGYEAGCLGFTLYKQLMCHNVECVILAPTTMLQQRGRKRVKTDKRDAALIARCLAHRDYSAVHIPTEQDEQVKDFIRMRADFKLELKRLKQQILSFCLKKGYVYSTTTNNWTQSHLKWLKELKPKGLDAETLEEYLITYDYYTEKLNRLDKRIEELASDETYVDDVKNLSCFMGIKSGTALTILTEVGDFKRFATAEAFASYIGLTPGEDSSGDGKNYLGITKAGNINVRCLLVEAAQSYCRGNVGFKSSGLKSRQEGASAKVIAYADRANERLRRKYQRLTSGKNKNSNVAKVAIARELACFIWGMVTGAIE